MPGKQMVLSQIKEAVALREAGYTLAMISERVGASTRTLQRLFNRRSIVRGANADQLIENAREELQSRFSSDELLKQEAYRVVADDLAHSRLLRDKMAVA